MPQDKLATARSLLSGFSNKVRAHTERVTEITKQYEQQRAQITADKVMNRNEQRVITRKFKLEYATSVTFFKAQYEDMKRQWEEIEQFCLHVIQLLEE